ncbi:MAG: hypothetical protein ACK502_04875 [Alphaproteobacteria bacterium]
MKHSILSLPIAAILFALMGSSGADARTGSRSSYETRDTYVYCAIDPSNTFITVIISGVEGGGKNPSFPFNFVPVTRFSLPSNIPINSAGGVSVFGLLVDPFTYCFHFAGNAACGRSSYYTWGMNNHPNGLQPNEIFANFTISSGPSFALRCDQLP